MARLMSWRCPACSTPINHNEADDMPRPGALYRCHVCRLELMLDPGTAKLTVAPLRDDDQRHERTSR